MDLAYPDLVLGSPLGRQFLAGYLGFEPEGSRGWPEVAPQEARTIIGAAVERGEWRQLLERDELGLLGDLADYTLGFGFGGDDEAVWELTALAEEELRPVAEALVTAPGARKWWEPAALADQRFLDWDCCPRVTGPAVERTVREDMQAERAENEEGLTRPRPPERPGTRIGACWWSAPTFAQLTWTTSAAGDIPALAFGHFIDTLWPFEETGVTVWSVQVAPHASVLEITQPVEWQRLVARFPRDVTGTHDGEWRYWGGMPGPWRLPDWERVMEHYDGVHVSIPAAGGQKRGWRTPAASWPAAARNAPRQAGSCVHSAGLS